jgi:hypothetical protein
MREGHQREMLGLLWLMSGTLWIIAAELVEDRWFSLMAGAGAVGSQFVGCIYIVSAFLREDGAAE